jgi:hypothetical protein
MILKYGVNEYKFEYRGVTLTAYKSKVLKFTQGNILTHGLGELPGLIWSPKHIELLTPNNTYLFNLSADGWVAFYNVTTKKWLYSLDSLLLVQ